MVKIICHGKIMAIRFASFQFSWTAINRWINWVIVAINDGSIADLNVDVLVIISVRRYLIRFLDSKALEGGYYVAAYALQAVTKTFRGLLLMLYCAKNHTPTREPRVLSLTLMPFSLLCGLQPTKTLKIRYEGRFKNKRAPTSA